MDLKVLPKHRDAAEKVDAWVCHMFDVTREELHYPSRKTEWARARFIAWYLLKNRFSMPLTVIGELYGKDHTTIGHGIERVPGLGVGEHLAQFQK